MHVGHCFWSSLSYLLDILSLSPVSGPGTENWAPLALQPVENHVALQPGPIFKPPSGKPHGEGSDFLCEYSQMLGYENCSTPEDRTCWLINRGTGHRFDISTDYEIEMPIGIHRTYELDVTDDTSINADGVNFDMAKLFNRVCPGPWLQACWGDVRLTAGVDLFNISPAMLTSIQDGLSQSQQLDEKQWR